MKAVDCQGLKNTFSHGNSWPLYIERGLFVKGKNLKKWNVGTMEYWVVISKPHHSNIPAFHHSRFIATGSHPPESDGTSSSQPEAVFPHFPDDPMWPSHRIFGSAGHLYSPRLVG